MKKIKIIIPICLAVIILLAIVLYFVFNHDTSNNTSKQNSQSSNINVADDIKKIDMDKRIKEILNLSYKYYLLSSGNVEVNKDKSITKGSKKI